MAAINSFTETTNDLIKQTNIALESMQKMNSTMTTEQDNVVITVEGTDIITGDSSTYQYSIPSYQYIISQLNRISNTVDTFVSGEGVVLLNDGTYREVSTVAVAKSPEKITGLFSPSNFYTKSNWFFESLMFPSIYIQYDLKGKIDDRSDRVKVKRVIFDNFDDIETQWFQTNFVNQTMSYSDALNILSVNGKNYWEDEETKNLPLKTKKYTGSFNITNKETIDSEEWFYLDTINYGLVSDTSTVKNIELKINDQLRYNNSVFNIKEIEVTTKRVRILPWIGLGSPTVNNNFEIYSTPFENKYVDIEIGYNECQILFLKGVNDDYNIIGDEWGDSIAFYSSDLILSDSNINLEDYYFKYVSDFGKEMEASAKEKFIPAWFGIIPAVPVIQSEILDVVQVNTQLNASLDTEEIKNSQTQIESTKTIINSLKTTIAQQKSELVSLTNTAQRDDLNSKISINVNDLAKRTVEYQSLVKSLSTLAYENDAIDFNPKYRVRGFFEIPSPKAISEYSIPQEIIQFEIAYRYLKLDNTGVELKTFEYNDSSTGQKKRGVFTDWTILSTPIKERIYDSSLGRYEWVQPIIANGDEVNINQIDIPLQKGEKVQIKVRSISEAGWPANSLKSDWSDAIVKEFPSNLQGSDQVVNILTDAVSEETAIKLDETLSASGVTTHMSDSIPNPNAGEGTYFKHQAINLAYDISQKDSDGVISSTSTTNLQAQLNNLSANTYVTLTKPPGSSSVYSQLTGTLQQLFQSIVNIDPSIYDEFKDLLI